MGLWDIDKIEYVGRQGVKEGLGFRYYDKNKVVAGKPMKDWITPSSSSPSWGSSSSASMTVTWLPRATPCARPTPILTR